MCESPYWISSYLGDDRHFTKNAQIRFDFTHQVKHAEANIVMQNFEIRWRTMGDVILPRKNGSIRYLFAFLPIFP